MTWQNEFKLNNSNLKLCEMEPATLDDIISVLDFSVVYKSSFRKTILLLTLVLSSLLPIYRILRVCCIIYVNFKT